MHLPRIAPSMTAVPVMILTVAFCVPAAAATDRARTTSPAGVSAAPLVGSPAATRRPARPASRSQAHRLDWAALAQCESGGDPRAGSGRYRGLYQFDRATWRSVGGRGDPADASAQEQTHRAQLLYDRAGASPWPRCGGLL